jgi:Spy/CpxP family protein refolding chaperone
MKKFYQVVVPLAGLVLLTSTALRADDSSAPSRNRAERREEMRENADKLAKELNLTPEQQAQVATIHQQTAESIKTMRSDPTLTEEQKRAKARDLRKASHLQVRALLTPDQREKEKDLRVTRKHRGADAAETSADANPATTEPAVSQSPAK